MYHLLTAQVPATAAEAADPGFAARALGVVEEGMRRAATERGRHLIERPRLVETDVNPLGLVTLTFNADAEDD